jgi:uncharacterized Zn finger protein
MREGGMAAGFPCPKCGCDLAHVLWLDPPDIVLLCRACEYVWDEGDDDG